MFAVLPFPLKTLLASRSRLASLDEIDSFPRSEHPLENIDLSLSLTANLADPFERY